MWSSAQWVNLPYSLLAKHCMGRCQQDQRWNSSLSARVRDLHYNECEALMLCSYKPAYDRQPRSFMLAFVTVSVMPLPCRSHDVAQMRTHVLRQCCYGGAGLFTLLIYAHILHSHNTVDCVTVQKCVNQFAGATVILEMCVQCACGKWRQTSSVYYIVQIALYEGFISYSQVYFVVSNLAYMPCQIASRCFSRIEEVISYTAITMKVLYSTQNFSKTDFFVFFCFEFVSINLHKGI